MRCLHRAWLHQQASQPFQIVCSVTSNPCHLLNKPALQIAVENAKGLGVPGGKNRPSVMAFSRQGMPNQPGTSIEGVAKGGYVVHGGDKKPDVILLSTGTPSPLCPPPASPSILVLSDVPFNFRFCLTFLFLHCCGLLSSIRRLVCHGHMRENTKPTKPPRERIGA